VSGGFAPADRVDLHVHSDCSDGRDPPEALCAARVALLSICDHDTIRAYERVPAGPRLLPGIEVSAALGDGEAHILGYFPAGFPAGFREWVAGREQDRRERIRDGVVALREDGIPVRWADFDAEVGDAVPCRTHVARCLVRLGMPRNPERLYERFLGRGRFRPATLPAAAAIGAIAAGGGIACWAHPSGAAIARHGASLVAAGLRGIEVHSPAVRGEHRAAALALAAEHRLLRSGGTDYHGGRHRRVGWYRVTVGDISEELIPR
jgi:predicted metal-dependent phosphoesterase TrpH